LTLHLRIHPTIHKNQIPTNSGTPENQTRPAFPLFKYGYLFFSHPDWVNNISYPPGYVIPFKCTPEKESHTKIWYYFFIDVEIEPEVRLCASISIIIDRCGLALLTCMA